MGIHNLKYSTLEFKENFVKFPKNRAPKMNERNLERIHDFISTEIKTRNLVAQSFHPQSIQKIGNSVRQSVIVHNLAGCKEILHRKNQLSEKNDLLKPPKINLEQK